MGDDVGTSGLDLSRSFFEEVVRPLVDRAVGPQRYAAGLLGPGSEVLGYDDRRSTDHDFGPRVVLTVATGDVAAVEAVRPALPATFGGRSLRFGASVGGSPWVHPLDVVTVAGLCTAWAGFDPLGEIGLVDWLSAPSNGLLQLTAGAVFHDGPGVLTEARRRLAWYPDDVWRWLLACQWRRVGQEHAFVGRCADVGDDLGSRIVAARLARDLLRLAFLIERRHAPYAKWLGTAALRLALGPALAACLAGALAADDAAHRQRHLADAYRLAAGATNALGLAPPVDPAPRPFHDRPFTVGPADDLADALLAGVTDPALRALRPHGGADQTIDSTDAGWHVACPLYAALLAGA